MENTHVLVAGGAGYVGSKLVPALLEKGYNVTVLDLYLFGSDIFEKHPNLREIQGDIRNSETVKNALKGIDHVIHLACISNDPSFELDPALGKAINFDAFEPFVQEAKKQRIRRFIYASSSSVYGIKEESNVTEDMMLEPLTDYSKFKAECETILLKYADETFITAILRPATICGYAKRQRLDLVVNILTNLAYHTGKIKIMGGEQLRPNIHIDDMVDAYLLMLEAPEELIAGEIFNVGGENHSVFELGNIVSKVVKGVKQEVVETNDKRSYHIASEKIAQALSFRPKRTIEDAVKDLVAAFEQGRLPKALEDERYFNIKTMNALKLK